MLDDSNNLCTGTTKIVVFFVDPTSCPLAKPDARALQRTPLAKPDEQATTQALRRPFK